MTLKESIMVTIEDYLQLGYRGIVILSSDWREKAGGYQDEHTKETFACFDKNGTPLKITIQWAEHFGGKYEKFHEVKSLEIITQNEYRELVKQYGVKDDSLYHQERAKKDKQKREAELKLQQMTPKCPVCGNMMVMKYRRLDNKPFWSCVGFRQGKCRGAMSVMASDYRKYSELSKAANQL
jgi:hypothetical protein